MYFSCMPPFSYHAQRDTARTRSVRVAERLVHLKLRILGYSARVVAMFACVPVALRSGKREVLPRTALDLTHKIVAVAAVRPLLPVLTGAVLPQSQHCCRRRSCTQSDAQPQSRHVCCCRPCMQKDAPPQSRH